MPGDADASAREARLRVARQLVELHRVHLALLQESRGLKRLTAEGQALAEIEIATELLEQYLGANAAFLENMRGRCEARLALLRRGEPQQGHDADLVPGHGSFWLAFSRFCAVLKRVEHGVTS